MLLAAVGVASVVVIGLAITNLYDHQRKTDYRLCQITRLQQADIKHLAEDAGIEVTTPRLPPCPPPP